MKINKLKKIKGYIEGYYGTLLNWHERKKIINALSKNKMNFYFYCPKDDINHRYLWREPYTKKWLSNFKKFNKYANEKNINIIAGIAPGLDFNYEDYLNGNKDDINLLLKKINNFIYADIKNIALMFDDIPNNNYKFKNQEGSIHARIINEIYSKCKLTTFAVPKIYSDELFKENPNYIRSFFETINKNISTFYCGKYIVSQSFNTNICEIKNKIKEDKIIFWDNFYANDYCPKRIFIGPWKNKNLINKSMINGTGMIETDLLILEIVNKTGEYKNKKIIWKNILKSKKVPNHFFKICKHFLSPNFTTDSKSMKFEINQSLYNNLDHLLWKWKSDLSREWYPYLLNFKQDLQILDKSLSYNRILKTQTNPLQIVLTRRRNIK
jgi:protein O-GlcNAcase/histone acetyltransferase